VRQESSETRRLLMNLVENSQRVDLSANERVGAVRQLASVGLGLEDIARGTGVSPSTLLRWIDIDGNKPLLEALQEGRIDLLRAMELVTVHNPSLQE
jgi:ParB-like chromosome segregation protein Spo0J